MKVGGRTYELDAELTIGRLVATAVQACSVPDGIWHSSRGRRYNGNPSGGVNRWSFHRHSVARPASLASPSAVLARDPLRACERGADGEWGCVLARVQVGILVLRRSWLLLVAPV